MFPTIVAQAGALSLFLDRLQLVAQQPLTFVALLMIVLAWSERWYFQRTHLPVFTRLAEERIRLGGFAVGVSRIVSKVLRGEWPEGLEIDQPKFVILNILLAPKKVPDPEGAKARCLRLRGITLLHQRKATAAIRDLDQAIASASRQKVKQAGGIDRESFLVICLAHRGLGFALQRELFAALRDWRETIAIARSLLARRVIARAHLWFAHAI